MSPDTAASLATVVLGIVSLALALVVFVTQQSSERKFRLILHALVTATLVTIPGDRSIGKSLLHFIRLNPDAKELLGESGARAMIINMYEARKRGENEISDDEWNAIQREWLEVFGTPLLR